MEQQEEDPPPFWLQSNATLRQADRHRRRRHQAASSLFLNTGVLVVLLLVAAIVFMSIVIPSVLSLARQVFNPSLVKSSWNSLNLILVLFAIVCGFFGRKDDDQTPVSSPMRRSESGKYTDSSPRQWYAYQNNRMQYNSFGNADSSSMRLRRNSNSYPDLRQDGPWVMNENRWRSYDDSHVYNYQFTRSDSRISRSKSLGVIDEDIDINTKNIEVDHHVYEIKEITPPSTPPRRISSPQPRPPSPPPKIVDDRSREVVDEDENEDEDDYETKNIEVDTFVSNQSKTSLHESKAPPTPAYIHQPLSPPSPLSPNTYFWPPPSPPPPPPPPPPPRAKNKHETKRESLYQMHMPPSSPSPNTYLWPPPSPPPPPPPPPPPRTHSSISSKNKRESKSKLQTPPPPPPQPRPTISHSSEDKSYKNKGIMMRTLHRLPRRKRRQSTRRSYENLTEMINQQQPPTTTTTTIHRSKSTPEFPPASPPPQPQPQHSSKLHNLFTKKSTKKKVHSLASTSTSTPPPQPPKSTIFEGGESPLNPIPPPPPPPPFKMKKSPWKFVMQGDYVKIESNDNSPRSGYSGSEDEENSPVNKNNHSMKSSLFCASPDVNTKADDFIAKFRAKLTLEKLNSIKQHGPSPLGGSDSGRY